MNNTAVPPTLFQRQVALDATHLIQAMTTTSQENNDDDDDSAFQQQQQQQHFVATSLYHYYNIQSGSITEMSPHSVVKCAPIYERQEPLFGKRQQSSNLLMPS
mmetsp:Transcript_11185/g.16422  ORF Transcript_11185/g.16422 Transcript_11185/m.16422 type:complete len:103 (+) Transcript_11185:153-461(+)